FWSVHSSCRVVSGERSFWCAEFLATSAEFSAKKSHWEEKKQVLMINIASHPLIARNFPQRLGIFVDVQNMFYSAKQFHQGKIDYGRLLSEITGQRHLIRAIAYIVQKADVNQDSFYSALTNL